MRSVAGRVLGMLADRLSDIRGQGDYVYDLQGRIYLRRFSFDADIEDTPSVFIARRVGGGTERTQKPGAEQLSDMTVVFDVVGVVALNTTTSAAAENLIADLQRALERPDDLFLRGCDGSGRARDLLSQELQIVSIETAQPLDGFPFEVVAVGVQCTWPHKYGDPNHVA